MDYGIDGYDWEKYSKMLGEALKYSGSSFVPCEWILVVVPDGKKLETSGKAEYIKKKVTRATLIYSTIPEIVKKGYLIKKVFMEADLEEMSRGCKMSM